MNGEMRIAITGANGFIGARLFEYLNVGHMIVPLLRNPPPRAFSFDLSQPAALHKTLDRLDIDLFIHAGAIARRRQCEIMPVLAHTVNVEATRVIASWAATRGVRVLFLSSVGVYEHSVYAETKRLAERSIEEIGGNASILRLAYSFGRSNSMSRPRPQALIEQEALNIGSQEFDMSWRFQPTSLSHLCSVIDHYIVRSDVLPRSLNVVTQDSTTFHGIAAAVLAHRVSSCRALHERIEKALDVDVMIKAGLPVCSVMELCEELKSTVRQQSQL